jgi:VWFA-related protein
LLAAWPPQSPSQTQQSEEKRAQETPLSGQTVIKATVTLVVVDVVVTDRDGQPVHGLQEQDFRVSEDGQEQQIRSFEAHMNAATMETGPNDSVKLPASTFGNYSKVPDNGPLNVIVFDTVNTPLETQMFARQELIKFLERKPATTQVAILVLADRVHILQGFTDDGRLLLAAANSKAAWPQLPPPDYMAPARTARTVDAFTTIAHLLVGVSGRKNLIWLSAGFPFVPSLNEFLGRPVPLERTQEFFVGGSPKYGIEARQVADLLVAAQVALYPVDVRGLETEPWFNVQGNDVKPTPGSRTEWYSEREIEHATVDSVVERSGGRSFLNSNRPHEAIGSAMAHGSNYYTLSYTPANSQLDGSERQIRVLLKEKGYHLAYRHNYFADDRTRVIAEMAKLPSDPLEASMQFGVPSLHGLIFQVHAAPVGLLAVANPDQMEVLSRFAESAGRRLPEKQKLQRYALEFAVAGKQLNLPALPNGTHRASLEFAVVAYDADGNKLNGAKAAVQGAVQAKTYQSIQNDGYRIRQEIDVPLAAVTLRVAVRDALTNRIGTLAIPLPLS